MKRILPILLVVIGLSSCLNTKSDFTPEISLSIFRTTDGDTLSFRFDELSGLWNLDSLSVGDTVYGAVGFASLGNNLVSTHVAWDTTAVKVWATFDQSVTSLLLSQSDTAKLDLYFPVGYNYLGLPLWIVPKRACSTPLKLTVRTDSKFSPAEETLVVNITE